MEWLKLLGPTILVLTGGFITWIIQVRFQQLRKLDEQLRENRLRVYEKFLDPFIQLLNEDESEDEEKLIEYLRSHEHRLAVFNVFMMGTDKVLSSYNEFQQFLYNNADKQKDNPVWFSREMFKHYGAVLLEVRKSLGNEKTTLKDTDMIKWLLSDFKEIFGDNPKSDEADSD